MTQLARECQLHRSWVSRPRPPIRWTDGCWNSWRNQEAQHAGAEARVGSPQAESMAGDICCHHLGRNCTCVIVAKCCLLDVGLKPWFKWPFRRTFHRMIILERSAWNTAGEATEACARFSHINVVMISSSARLCLTRAN